MLMISYLNMDFQIEQVWGACAYTNNKQGASVIFGTINFFDFDFQSIGGGGGI